MDIILKEDIKGLGYKHDVLKVKAGYGRNFLIPKGFAVIANDSNMKVRNETVKQTAHRMEKIKTEAEDTAAKLANITLQLGAKVGESGKIFGAITTVQVADALKEKGIEIDRRKISFNSEIKTVGVYSADIDLHREVKATVAIEVVAE